MDAEASMEPQATAPAEMQSEISVKEPLSLIEVQQLLRKRKHAKDHPIKHIQKKPPSITEEPVTNDMYLGRENWDTELPAEWKEISESDFNKIVVKEPKFLEVSKVPDIEDADAQLRYYTPTAEDWRTSLGKKQSVTAKGKKGIKHGPAFVAPPQASVDPNIASADMALLTLSSTTVETLQKRDSKNNKNGNENNNNENGRNSGSSRSSETGRNGETDRNSETGRNSEPGRNGGSSRNSEYGRNSGPSGNSETGRNSGPSRNSEYGRNSGPSGNSETGRNSGPSRNSEYGRNSGPSGNSETGRNSGPSGKSEYGSNSGPSGNSETGRNNGHVKISENGMNGQNANSGNSNGNNSNGNSNGNDKNATGAKRVSTVDFAPEAKKPRNQKVSLHSPPITRTSSGARMSSMYRLKRISMSDSLSKHVRPSLFMRNELLKKAQAGLNHEKTNVEQWESIIQHLREIDAFERNNVFQKLVAQIIYKDESNRENAFLALQRVRSRIVNLRPDTLANINIADLEELLHPIAAYTVKAKQLRLSARVLSERRVSSARLFSIPLLSPEIVSMCMSMWKNFTSYEADEHIHRVITRLHLYQGNEPKVDEARAALEQFIPRESLAEVIDLLVGFGRTVCTPILPYCDECLNRKICPSYGQFRPSKLLQYVQNIANKAK